MKKILVLLLLTVLAVTAVGVLSGCGTPSEGLEYVLNKDMTVTVKSIGLCGDKNVVIPATYNNAPVVEIADYAFSGYAIESVTIPDSVTRIGKNAFADCKKLGKVSIEGKNVEIDYGAFSGCTSLVEITVKSGFSYIGNPYVGSGVQKVNFEGEFLEIPYSIFADCRDLESLTLPNGVKKIKAYAFSNSGITTLTIPESITQIEDYAFAGSKIVNIIIPKTVTSMGSYVFSGCDKLESITVGANSKPSGWSNNWNYTPSGSKIENNITYGGHVHKLVVTNEKKANCLSGGTITKECSSCHDVIIVRTPKSTEHTADGSWITTSTTHKKRCLYCSGYFDSGEHEFASGECTECGYHQ